MVGTYLTVKNEQKECQILQSRLLTLTTEKNKKIFKLVHIGLNWFSEEKKCLQYQSAREDVITLTTEKNKKIL